MATYASEILNSDDYRNAIKKAMAKDCRYEDEHDGFENFSADSDHWLVIAEMLETKVTLITELVGALEGAQKALAMMVDDDAIRKNNVAVAFAQCRASEQECRAAITKAKDQTNDR